MSDKYILNDAGEPVPEEDLATWGAWFEKSRCQRIVKQEMVGESKVSTVFLALDHQWGDGPPLLWETMVFDGNGGGEQDRCSGGREQAEAMHQRMVERVMGCGQ